MAEIIEKTAESLDKWLNGLGDITDKYINLEGVISNVTDLFVDQAKEIRLLNKELGNGSKTSAELKGQFAALSAQLGVTSRETLELLNVTKSYHQGVKDNTAITLQFIKASGASADVVGKLSARLNILGGVSDETLTSMYENLLSVRDAYGLTTDQLDDVISLTDKYAVATQASGKQVSQATAILAKFTSQLTSAGIEAGRVSDILESMLDPDRLTDNLILMNKIGISMTDMISGDPVAKLEGSAEKLKQLGQEISNIAQTNRLQANEIAKVYGLTLEEANMLAKLDTSKQALNTEKKLEQYRQEITTFSGSIKAFGGMLSGIISGPLSIIGKQLENFTNTMGMLPRGLQNITALFVGKVLINLLRKGLEKVMGQAAKTWSNAVGEYLPKVSERFTSKMNDASALKPNRKENKLDYGWGFNRQIKGEEKLNATNKKLGRIGAKGIGELTPGEMIETISNLDVAVQEKRKYGALLKGVEKNAFENTYGVKIKSYDDSARSIIDSIQGREKWQGEDEAIQSWARTKVQEGNVSETLTGKNVETLIKDLEYSGKIGNTEELGLKEAGYDVIKIAADASGPKEFLERMIEFWKLSNNPNASEYLKNTTEHLDSFNQETIEYAGNVEKLSEVIKKANDVTENSTKTRMGGFKQRFGGLLEGIKGGLKSGALNLLNKLNPINLIKKSWKIGVAGIGMKLISSLTKTEKFQKWITDTSEWFSGIFDNLVTNFSWVTDVLTSVMTWLKPKIEWLANIIGKIGSVFGAKLTKAVSNIADSVSTIEDTYKQEDLKSMVGGVGVYDSFTDTIAAKLDNIYYKVVDVTKRQEIAADATVANSLRNNG